MSKDLKRTRLCALKNGYVVYKVENAAGIEMVTAEKGGYELFSAPSSDLDKFLRFLNDLE